MRGSGATTPGDGLDVLAPMICAHVLARSAYSGSARDRQLCAGRILPSKPDEPSPIWGLNDAMKRVGLAVLGMLGRPRENCHHIPTADLKLSRHPAPIQRSPEV